MCYINNSLLLSCIILIYQVNGYYFGITTNKYMIRSSHITYKAQMISKESKSNISNEEGKANMNLLWLFTNNPLNNKINKLSSSNTNTDSIDTSSYQDFNRQNNIKKESLTSPNEINSNINELNLNKNANSWAHFSS